MYSYLSLPEKVTYGDLCAKHPSYLGPYMHRLEAFYAGGRHLLGCSEVLDEVFPRHRNERDSVYRERVRRAYYVPYAKEIVGHLVSSLFQAPLTLAAKDDGNVDDYYNELQQHIGPDGAAVCTLSAFMRQVVIDVLVKGVAYSLVDMPVPTREYVSLAEQEAAGALRAYAVRVAPECVVNWRDSAAGELEWATVYQLTDEAEAPVAKARRKRHTWKIYTADGWAEYAIDENPMVRLMPEDEVPRIAGGRHSFGAVPLLRLRPDASLWLMENVESMVREHFNKGSALAWAEVQSLFPELHYFLKSNQNCGVALGDAAAAERMGKIKQDARGPGYSHELDSEDRVEFVGPDTTAFGHAAKRLTDLRDEIHRVTHVMALAQEGNGAMLRASADSKAHTRIAESVVLGALATKVREYAERMFAAISQARGDVAMVANWHASGLDAYNAMDAAEVIKQGAEAALIEIPSKTFKVMHALMLAKALLGEDVDEAIYAKIESELAANVVAEAPDMPEPEPPPAGEPDTNEE